MMYDVRRCRVKHDKTVKEYFLSGMSIISVISGSDNHTNQKNHSKITVQTKLVCHAMLAKIVKPTKPTQQNRYSSSILKHRKKSHSKTKC